MNDAEDRAGDTNAEAEVNAQYNATSLEDIAKMLDSLAHGALLTSLAPASKRFYSGEFYSGKYFAYRDAAAILRNTTLETKCGEPTPPATWREFDERHYRVLAVGEPCAGEWIGPPDASLRQWACRCGATRPEGCKTETAKP